MDLTFSARRKNAIRWTRNWGRTAERADAGVRAQFAGAERHPHVETDPAAFRQDSPAAAQGCDACSGRFDGSEDLRRREMESVPARGRQAPHLAQVHLAFGETNMDIIAIEVTTAVWGDSEILPSLLDQFEGEIAQVSADGAYATAAMRRIPRGTRVPPSRHGTGR